MKTRNRSEPDHSGRTASGVTLLLRLEGLALFVVITILYEKSGGGFGRLALLFLAPDLSLLFYLFGGRAGGIAYNIAHSTIGALLLAGLGETLGQPALFLLSLIWLAHIGFDRALGYGLKRGSEFSQTHLGDIGRRRARRRPERGVVGVSESGLECQDTFQFGGVFAARPNQLPLC